MASFTTTIEGLIKNGQEIQLEVEGEFEIGNDGIGHYEFWGQKCFDSGHPVLEMNVPEDITILSAVLDGREISEVKLQTIGFLRLAEQIMAEREHELVECAWNHSYD